MTTPAHDPTYLGAAETGWEQGYDAAVAHASGGSVPRNPYTQLRDDRRAYVRDQIIDTYGDLRDEEGDSLFDNTEVLDAILDAHADWIAGQRLPQSAPLDVRGTIVAATACARELRGNGPAPDTGEAADLLDELVAAVIAARSDIPAKPTPNVTPDVRTWTAHWQETTDWTQARYITVDRVADRIILHVSGIDQDLRRHGQSGDHQPAAVSHLCSAMWAGRIHRCARAAGHPGEHKCECGDRSEGQPQ